MRNRRLSIGSRRAVTGLAIATLVLSMAVAGLARQNPHLPTEAEAKAEETGVRADPLRGYQQRSVEENQSLTRRGIGWVREMLARIHITPARLLLILGALGTLITWGKNKHKVQWMVLSIFSWLLAIVGACAMFFRWPYMN